MERHDFEWEEGTSLLRQGMPLIEPDLARRGAFAATLEARGGLSTRNIARTAGLTLNQMEYVRSQEWYGSIVRRVLDDAIVESGARTLASKAGRLAHIQRRYDALQQVVEERAVACDPRYADPADPANAEARRMFPDLGVLHDPGDPVCAMSDRRGFNVPGASTGLLTVTTKAIGGGFNTRFVDEWSLDRGLIEAQAGLEEQAARETGQRFEKTAGGKMKMYIGVDIDSV